jgi:hypothetical protein
VTRRTIIWLALAGLLAGGWLWWRHVYCSDPARIKRLIARMERAVEQGNLLKLEGAIAQDYADEYGLDKSTLLATVRTYRQQYESVLIDLREFQLMVEPDSHAATAEFVARVAAKMQAGQTEPEVQDLRARLWFRKTNDSWQMRRAECADVKL